ncbi:jun dimerization protein 2-like [Actinia tenebrosa]|uniref:Jun dimerization protein 2-like n=1 Tax=Actinia tenebrosa TaxID=6105 RepID=A0A6P8HCR0_ACTTE|nr:jun dimerization protein 2-like [Actinia tenebrosa]
MDDRMDDSIASPKFFYVYPESCASSLSSNTDFSMGTASNSTSTNEWHNPFQHAATNFFQQETAPKAVKTELKKVIQVRKIANGEEMPEIEWKKPPTPQPRPPEKPEDIQLRRQKNKIAAKKCREKKRIVREEYKKKIKKQEEIQSRLTKEVEKLRQEFWELKNNLQNHLHHCTLNTASTMNTLTSLQQLAQQTDFNANALFNVDRSLPPQ